MGTERGEWVCVLCLTIAAFAALDGRVVAHDASRSAAELFEQTLAMLDMRIPRSRRPSDTPPPRSNTKTRSRRNAF